MRPGAARLPGPKPRHGVDAGLRRAPNWRASWFGQLVHAFDQLVARFLQVPLHLLQIRGCRQHLTVYEPSNLLKMIFDPQELSGHRTSIEVTDWHARLAGEYAEEDGSASRAVLLSSWTNNQPPLCRPVQRAQSFNIRAGQEVKLPSDNARHTTRKRPGVFERTRWGFGLSWAIQI
jgi:hypothetical protein